MTTKRATDCMGIWVRRSRYDPRTQRDSINDSIMKSERLNWLYGLNDSIMDSDTPMNHSFRIIQMILICNQRDSNDSIMNS